MKKLYNGVVAVIIMSVAILGETTVWSQIESTNQHPAITNTGAFINSKSENEHRQHDFNHVCPTDFLNNQYMTENGLQHLLFEDDFARQNTSSEHMVTRSVRRVPVVFHIVYNNQNQNISDQAVLELLNNLNQDFRKNNPMLSGIRAEFSDLAADVEIEFCLASVDPSGNYTKGITRTNTSITHFNPYQNQVNGNIGGANSMKTNEYGKASWDPSKYINIWVCNISNGANSGMAGYAYTPIGIESNGLPASNIDGIVLDYNLGVQNGYSRTVSHEMGHYFGLKHTWGSANGACNSGDDGFFDTPTVKGAFVQFHSNCASGANALSCDGTLWQFENLMDYSDCIAMFTPQQANYMNAVLSGSRSTLLNSAEMHCTANTNSALTAAFSGCVNTSAGNVITLTSDNNTQGADVVWSISPATGWSFVNGTNITSSNPQIVFNHSGNYAVSLTVSDGVNTLSHQVNDCVFVTANASVNEYASESIQIYPNPSTGIFNVNLSDLNSDIRVYNGVGVTVLNLSATSYTHSIDMSAFSSGVYFLEVKSAAGSHTQRIVLAK
ncbi:MAG: T9SS type A sorting domain-containing protein [Flavobacteriales bacterium]|nr:T9SS type A sorting domain-containing protein [Flavobacteriales bacterium]